MKVTEMNGHTTPRGEPPDPLVVAEEELRDDLSDVGTKASRELFPPSDLVYWATALGFGSSPVARAVLAVLATATGLLTAGSTLAYFDHS